MKEQPRDTTFRARIHVDGDYVKAYVNEDRVVNFPSATFARSKTIQINLPAASDTPTMIGNVLIPAGGNSMSDALTSDGRVTTQGIYFDANDFPALSRETQTARDFSRAAVCFEA